MKKSFFFLLIALLIFLNQSWAKNSDKSNKYFSYADVFNSTSIRIGYETGVITRKEAVLEGSSWGMSFPLSPTLRTVFTLNCLKSKDSTAKYYTGRGGLTLHFSPTKRADPYLEVGLLGERKEVTGSSPKGGMGWYGGMGIRLLLSRYASLIVFGGYLKDGVFKDDAITASITVNTCYKQLCARFEGAFTSKRNFWDSSETLTFQGLLQVQFSVIKIIEEVKEILGSDSWSL
ncbi:MAG: hypothetical protein GXO57_03855 [Thermodesulfobacteria bacterium]|nr:hypothetical protein [Thermodesulfobacteriota bacterium]